MSEELTKKISDWNTLINAIRSSEGELCAVFDRVIQAFKAGDAQTLTALLGGTREQNFEGLRSQGMMAAHIKKSMIRIYEKRFKP